MTDEKKRDLPVDIASFMENAFLMGIGALEITREKTTELADDLMERGRMSNSDAKEVADKIAEVGRKQQEVMRSTVASETDRAMKNAGVATKAEIDLLREEIAELKAMIAGLQASKDTSE